MHRNKNIAFTVCKLVCKMVMLPPACTKSACALMSAKYDFMLVAPTKASTSAATSACSAGLPSFGVDETPKSIANSFSRFGSISN